MQIKDKFENKVIEEAGIFAHLNNKVEAEWLHKEWQLQAMKYRLEKFHAKELRSNADQ